MRMVCALCVRGSDARIHARVLKRAITWTMYNCVNFRIQILGGRHSFRLMLPATYLRPLRAHRGIRVRDE